MPEWGERGRHNSREGLSAAAAEARFGLVKQAEKTAELSEREKEVARFLAKGVSNKEIARGLGIEVVTVKKHVGNILRKLGARNRTQAAVKLAGLRRQ